MRTQKDRDYQLTQIAIMHFQKGVSQQDIASRFGLSKMTISRMLQEAKDKFILQINVTLPFQIDLQKAEEIVGKYQIKTAIIVKSSDNEKFVTTELIGKIYAFYMGIALQENHVLGMGVGKTIGQIVQNLFPMNTQNLHIVQLMGGLEDVNYANPFTIVQETCRKLHATGTYISSYATVECKALRESFLYKSEIGERVIGYWKKCKEALFGIGTIEKGTLLSPKLVMVEEIQKLKKLGAVGDVLGHCFDSKGNFIHTNLEDRLISIPTIILKKIENRTAVAAGAEKASAIHGALLSGLITTLVTDDKTAAVLLE